MKWKPHRCSDACTTYNWTTRSEQQTCGKDDEAWWQRLALDADEWLVWNVTGPIRRLVRHTLHPRRTREALDRGAETARLVATHLRGETT